MRTFNMATVVYTQNTYMRCEHSFSIGRDYGLHIGEGAFNSQMGHDSPPTAAR
jgi:hypothetical protein